MADYHFKGGSDQYADGNAATVWEHYIGCKEGRTSQYKNWLCGLLHKHGCHNLIDVACGTGVDSILLLENGFKVTSTDGCYRMLKTALQKRWNRRKEQAFDGWVIEEGNWLTLRHDLNRHSLPSTNYDSVLCLGNSFAHLLEAKDNKQEMRLALENFRKLLKPGGVLIIDHRNFDAAIETGKVPTKNVYYNSTFQVNTDTVVLHKNGEPCLVSLQFNMDVPGENELNSVTQQNKQAMQTSSSSSSLSMMSDQSDDSTFTLNFYPHRLEAFTSLLLDVFGSDCQHQVYGDFREFDPDDDSLVSEDAPGFFIHVVQRTR